MSIDFSGVVPILNVSGPSRPTVRDHVENHYQIDGNGNLDRAKIDGKGYFITSKKIKFFLKDCTKVHYIFFEDSLQYGKKVEKGYFFLISHQNPTLKKNGS